MKIQCSCGAKVEFDITPEMTANPVKFICPACGLDSSGFVDGLVREQLAGVQVSASLKASDKLKLELQPEHATCNPQHAPPTAGETPALLCSRHPGQLCFEKCYVCSKPICPKCMELFGYLCSPLCKAKANSHGIQVPVFAGQKSLVEARYWRRVAHLAWGAGGLVAVLIGLWIWYAWVLSEPKPAFSVRFPEMAYSGQSVICDKDQIVFLHGSTLARHDMKQKKEIWSRDLVDHKKVAAESAKWLKEFQAAAAKWNETDSESDSGFKPRIPSLEKVIARQEKAAAAELELRVRAHNLWVSAPGKLVRYDWESGKPAQEFPLKEAYTGLIARGDELLLVDNSSGKPVITHLNLSNCESRIETLATAPPPDFSPARTNAPPARSSALAALDPHKPLDPSKVAEQVRHLSLAARLALPAMLSARMNQERALAELGNQPARDPNAPEPEPEYTSLVPTREGFVQFSERVVESHIVSRSAMKAPPARSALDRAPSLANSGEMINETLNELQRAHGGDQVFEDLSRYRVTLRQLDGTAEWSGEVIGPPTLFPLETVKVLAANKMIIVFDKANQKLWQSSLTHSVRGDLSQLDEENTPYGRGPCIEHNGALYVYDEGVLTTFDLATGNARWRIPSVGITGLFFDDKGDLYVNTTTASPESIKYSRQIDISQDTKPIVLKLDGRSGKTLWTVYPGGFINYVSGKFIYTVAHYAPDENDDLDFLNFGSSEENTRPSYLRIRRISPRDGHEMWEHSQQRAPLDVQFDKNIIRLVFKKEVQVLKFLTF
jgi:hypothetical protein